MNTRLIVASLLFLSSAASAQPPSLNCHIGPTYKTFGGSEWIVYGCDDNHSVVVITAASSPASPFYFFFAHKDGGYRLVGEGTGNKSATEAAYKELSDLKPADIEQLFTEANKVEK